MTATMPKHGDCRPLLAGEDDLTVVFQPIVDLASATVAGYEAQARFPGTAAPDVWYAAAAEAGLGAELEALALRKALAALPDLPPHTFLTVTVRPHLLGSVPVAAAFAEPATLRGVVVALTEHLPTPDLDALRTQTAALRSRGALIAVRDAGSGLAGLQQLAEVRPQLVTLDRALVAGAGTDPVKAALVELVGTFTSRIDAWLLADGIETAAELAVSARLGVPLAQGWLLGRPTPSFAELAPEVAALVRSHVARAHLADGVTSLLRPVRRRESDEDDAVPAPCVLLDPAGVPVELVLADPRTGAPYRAPVSLTVHPSADVPETLQRALTRPPVHRFDPVVCTDRSGAVLGLLRVEDLASAAASR
ncbi:EAL domain-containing protein [Modestobacter sp. I12A-02662]|uniref:EAL domain-containing protein n=1 Tax=Modestobacter sp. I12A-02662 TaxID=1730496 RepID=UPI0034DEF426